MDLPVYSYNFIDILLDFGSGLLYLVGCFLLFVFGKMVYQVLNRHIKVNEELVKKDNVAFAVTLSGYFLGLVFTIGGALVGPSNGIVHDLVDLIAYGLFGIVLMNISALINDKIILFKFKIEEEIIRDQNAGTGAIQFASYLSTGLILYGAISGEGGGFDTALAFWGLGQIAMVIGGFIYNWMTPFDVHKEIEKDNVAAGVSFAGLLLAIGNLARFACSGDWVGWAENLSGFGYLVLFGLIVMPVIRFITDKILLPGERLSDEIAKQEKPNLGAAFVEAVSYLGASFLIGWAL
ncbi:DUF350 domain-containing protein [bacterium]|nr:DUF350 domain-containing protein [bacterium]